MIISKELCKLEIDGMMVEQVLEFNYLGLKITSSGNLVKEIKPKLKMQQEWLNDLLWRNKNMRKETK